MQKIVRIALLLYGVFLVCTMLSFLYAHGGFRGDYEGLSDNPAGDVIFNRWFLVDSSREPILVRAFLKLHFVCKGLGNALYYQVLRPLLPLFRSARPLGLSADSYPYLFMLLLAPFQWYLIARLLQRLLGAENRPT